MPYYLKRFLFALLFGIFGLVASYLLHFVLQTYFFGMHGSEVLETIQYVDYFVGITSFLLAWFMSPIRPHY